MLIKLVSHEDVGGRVSLMRHYTCVEESCSQVTIVQLNKSRLDGGCGSRGSLFDLKLLGDVKFTLAYY